MSKFWTRLILRAVIYSYIMLFSVVLGPDVYMGLGKRFYFVDSYVAEVNMPTYGNDTTIDMLKKFDQSVGGGVIAFKPNEQFSRAVRIREADQIPGKESVIGQALPLWTECDIVIEKGLDYETYYQVLLHEYLHCLGYMHTNDPNDLMYPSVTMAPESNLLKYAKEIKERRKWKNLKN